MNEMGGYKRSLAYESKDARGATINYRGKGELKKATTGDRREGRPTKNPTLLTVFSQWGFLKTKQVWEGETTYLQGSNLDSYFKMEGGLRSRATALRLDGTEYYYVWFLGGVVGGGGCGGKHWGVVGLGWVFGGERWGCVRFS